MINGETIQISTAQLDELNSLEAIYGSEFFQIEQTSPPFPKIVNVILEKCSKNDRTSIILTLKFQLPDDYPGKSPPFVEINCPYMNKSVKNRLYDRLQEIYMENLSEPILYLWIEESRSFLEDFGTFNSKNVENLETEELNVEIVSLNDTLESSSSSMSSDLILQIPDIVSGSTISDRKSVFQAHLAHPVVCKEQVSLILAKLKENSKISRATHNIYAYRISASYRPSSSADGGDRFPSSTKTPNVFLQDCEDDGETDCEDDGETQAGQRLLHLLTLMKAENVLVVVSRWYGGVHLGADRFKHINNAARLLLEQNGFGSPNARKNAKK
uniref:RWD domain-containing protein n=1 Tax=Romanomermis culicivorax TaxID=13658 RepID=A0A915I9C7_ROMCU